jgi:hypothetical protein
MIVFTKTYDMQAILVTRNCKDEISIQMTEHFIHFEDVHIFVLMIGLRMTRVMLKHIAMIYADELKLTLINLC